MKTKRIDNTRELERFLIDLQQNYIDIPINVTLEIDSDNLKREMMFFRNTWSYVPLSKNFDEFKYMGQKITIKNKI